MAPTEAGNLITEINETNKQKLIISNNKTNNKTNNN